MDLYRKKKIWKRVLFLGALVIIAVSLWYSNGLVKKIAEDEREKIKIWANAIQHKASLVSYTNEFFKKIEIEERNRVEIWAEATRRLINAGINEDLSFYTLIIAGNNTIPVILTDKNLNIIAAKNVDFSTDTVKVFDKEKFKDFAQNEPIIVSYGNIINYLYFKESILFSELRVVLDDLTESFFSEVVINSASVPVLIMDSTKTKIFSSGNIDEAVLKDSVKLKELILTMEGQNNPIIIDFEGTGKKYIYYKDSFLLTQLKYYTFIQLFIVAIFIIIAYLVFNTTQKSEQNSVWVGMAKETAHQLGTPISSMLAWLDFIEADEKNKIYIEELRKDIKRLQDVSDRFNNIGSNPDLPLTPIAHTIYDSVRYIQSRASKKVIINVQFPEDERSLIPLNNNLFSWVMENLLKNAIDAMNGEGTIDISILKMSKYIIVDISDTGRGFAKANYKTVFRPGYTTKKRGWGLGLTLSKRIIEEYHKGKLFVYSSVVGKGTTFRIQLPYKQ